MSDTSELLPKSRQYFKNFITSNRSNIMNCVKECRTTPGSGYSAFYKSDEIIQHLRDIAANIDETFKNIEIPSDFPSPKRLAQTWQRFYEILITKDDLIKDIHTNIVDEAKRKYGAKFDEMLEDDMIFPLPFLLIVNIHQQFKDMLEYILDMDEVKTLLNAKKADSHVPSAEVEISGFDIAIITALYDTEFEALMKLPVILEEFKVTDDPTDYKKSKIGNTNVLFATDDAMGMAAATCLTTKIIAKFNPKYIIMAGIAGGVINGKSNYGDILVARWSFNYESGKYKFNKKANQSIFEPNPEQVQMESSILPMINKIKLNKDILQKISDDFVQSEKHIKPDKELNVFVGPIASGSAVIADSKRIEEIRAGNRKLIGIDMETFGVMYAAKSYSDSHKTIAISIKSISDFADQRKSDKYRQYAAHTSAMFIYKLILDELQTS